MATTNAGRRRVRDPARTREAIAEALLDLLNDGDRVPTAETIAARAGVSRRSVFAHFADLDELYVVSARLQIERLHAASTPIDHQLSFAERVQSFVAQRERVYLAMTPVRRMALAAAPDSPVLAESIDRADAWLREQLAEVFAPELAGRPPELLDEVDAAVSWAAWYHLRRLAPVEVRRCQRHLLEVLLTTT
jgi:AcrR family transcriptional regulator